MKIQDIDADFAWGAFAMLVLATILTVIITTIVKDHQVTRYYASDGGVQNTCRWIAEENRTVCNTPICIWANVPWMADSKVYCTSDTDTAIKQLKQLNETLK